MAKSILDLDAADFVHGTDANGRHCRFADFEYRGAEYRLTISYDLDDILAGLDLLLTFKKYGGGERVVPVSSKSAGSIGNIIRAMRGSALDHALSQLDESMKNWKPAVEVEL